MASMTDYMVLLAGNIELSDSPGGPGDVKHLPFNLPDNFTVGTNFGRPVLAFIINPRSDNAKVGIWVNPEGPNFQLNQDTQVEELNWSNASHHDQALWKVVDGREFNKGEENNIFFKAWDGRIVLREVVLWFQRGPGD